MGIYCIIFNFAKYKAEVKILRHDVIRRSKQKLYKEKAYKENQQITPEITFKKTESQPMFLDRKTPEQKYVSLQ